MRGHRLHEEYTVGKVELLHCPTKEMLADALTKLAPAPVIAFLHEAMHGGQPLASFSTPPCQVVKACNVSDGRKKKVHFSDDECLNQSAGLPADVNKSNVCV